MRQGFRGILLCFVAVAACGGEPLWSLGRKDGSAAEFQLQYNPWEYGRTPQLVGHPAMKDFVFTYRIPESGVPERPPVVSGIGSENFRNWMYPGEIVTGLVLVWSEKQPGNRELLLDFAGWRNNGDARDGLALTLPDGSRDYLSLPEDPKEKQFSRRVVFPVAAGENTFRLDAIGNGKYFQVKFDALQLRESTELPSLGRHLRFSFDGFSQIYHPGDRVKVTIDALRIPDGELLWTLSDAFGQKVGSGRAEIRSERAVLELAAAERGYFKLECRAGGLTRDASFVVLEPVAEGRLPESRFGAHALPMDAYYPVWHEEAAEKNIRRAALAGVKHCRYHGLKWNLVAPDSPDRSDWTLVDRKVALAEKYNMTLLLNPWGTPEWASPVKSRKLAPPIGVPQFSVYPPEEGAWRKFVGELLTRYRGRVSRYEFWNEPSYRSVFWLDGSPASYAKLLKGGLEAARAADPDAVIYSGGLFNAAVGFLDEAIRANGGKLYFDVMGIHYPGDEVYQAWRSLLDRNGGADVPLVNTEGHAGNREATSLEQGGAVVKSYVIDAANHVKQTYGFLFFSNNQERQVRSFFDSVGNPQPAYAAFRTMTHRLEGADYLGDLSSDRIAAYLFERDGKAVIAAWALLPGETFRLDNVPPEMTLVDLMDCEKTLATPDGLEVALTTLPVFLEGGDPAVLQKAGQIRSPFRAGAILLPGETLRRRLAPAGDPVKFQMNAPEAWTCRIVDNELILTPPEKTEEGNYRLTGGATVSVGGHEYRFPLELAVRVSLSPVGTNLLRNGDFSNGTAFWWAGKGGKLECRGGEGGERLIEVASAPFGPTGSIPVQFGERYLISASAEGDGGLFGVMYSLFDRNGKRVFPAKDGLNILQHRSTPDRRNYHAVFEIKQPEAVRMSLLMLANLGKPEGRTRFERFGLFRIESRYGIPKLLFQGDCSRGSTPVVADGRLEEWNGIPAMRINSADLVVGDGWKGAADLSATAKLLNDGRNLCFAFEVKDDRFFQNTPETPWEGDSIQFSIDPGLDGRDYHEFTIFRDDSGRCRLIRNHLYWTPELPTGLTRTGEIADAEVVARPVEGGMIYEGKIPFTQLFPLTAETGEFGFSFLVNDNDGSGRKYIRWSDGIGGRKNPAEFGLVRSRK